MGKELQINLKFIGALENDIKTGDVINIDNKIEAVAKDIHQAGLGFGTSQVIIDYLFSVFFVGVPGSLIASLIYDEFLKGKNKFIDETREITIITKEDLIKYINLLKKEQEIEDN